MQTQTLPVAAAELGGGAFVRGDEGSEKLVGGRERTLLPQARTIMGAGCALSLSAREILGPRLTRTDVTFDPTLRMRGPDSRLVLLPMLGC